LTMVSPAGNHIAKLLSPQGRFGAIMRRGAKKFSCEKISAQIIDLWGKKSYLCAKSANCKTGQPEKIYHEASYTLNFFYRDL
ncbi:MAG: hypothetical protein K2F88_01390, partial [Duncaniella sp.]|nr:hypothetical protein [Duncaniella sp.]